MFGDLGQLCAFLFTPWVLNSARPPQARMPSAAPIIIPVWLIPAPLSLADSQPQSDLTRSRRRHASSCQLNGQVACLLKHKSRSPEACWSQETNTENCLHGVAKRAGAHSCRLITKSTGKEENLIEAQAIFLLPKGAHLPPQGQSTLFPSQTQIENYNKRNKIQPPTYHLLVCTEDAYIRIGLL